MNLDNKNQLAEVNNDLSTFNYLKDCYVKLKTYCEKEDYKGWDPYDGLNSKFFSAIPFIRNNRFARLAWVQIFKRSPVNLRKIFGVPKEHNNKGLGLFLAAYCKEYNFNRSPEILNKIEYVTQLIIKYKLTNYSGACWGYNFDWQARAFFQPKNMPTVVATTFISNALLDAYEITKNQELLSIARSACDFILKDLNRTYDEKNNFSFSYSPADNSVVFNASLLGSRLLARVYSYTGESILLDEAKKSVLFCVDHQRPDGSWGYGTLPFHQWVDNFHTGFNLGCIADFIKYSGLDIFKKELEKGFEYYINTFFTEEGVPKYYNNSVYPIDIHAPAQLVITISKLNKFEEYKEIINKVLVWTSKNMNSGKGYYYFQINKYLTSKIPYMRWAQAWMLYALATYIDDFLKINILSGQTDDFTNTS